MTYIYASAKHRRSGSSMKKSKGRGDMERYRAARKVLPGFPAAPFKRIEDVDYYVSGDWITCLLCGKPYKDTTKHIVRIHQMSISDYRVRFNIPSRYSLMVEDTRNLHAANARRNNLDGRLERARENAEQRRRTRAKLTAFGRAVHTAKLTDFGRDAITATILKVCATNKGKNLIDTDCSWHLEQVATVYAFKSVKPPKGEIAWRTYKTRRRKDPALNAAHKEARKRWEREYRGSWRNKAS